MAIITQTVHLTTKTNNIPQIVRAVQNDSGRDIKMILDDLEVTSGMTGELNFKRSDGTFYGVTATPNTSDSSFTAQMDQALTQPGKTYAQLKVTNTDVVSTFSFVIYVEADQSGTVTPQEGIDLVSAVEAAEDAADRAESAAAMFDEDVQGYVDEWLDDHPEVTTTVQDGSLNEAKFSDALKLKTIKDYVTPEMFGCVGDGVTNDTDNFKLFLKHCYDNGVTGLIPAKTYLIDPLTFNYSTSVESFTLIGVNKLKSKLQLSESGWFANNGDANLFNKAYFKNINFNGGSGCYGFRLWSDGTSKQLRFDDCWFNLDGVLDTEGTGNADINTFINCGGYLNEYLLKNNNSQSVSTSIIQCDFVLYGDVVVGLTGGCTNFYGGAYDLIGANGGFIVNAKDQTTLGSGNWEYNFYGSRFELHNSLQGAFAGKSDKPIKVNYDGCNFGTVTVEANDFCNVLSGNIVKFSNCTFDDNCNFSASGTTALGVGALLIIRDCCVGRTKTLPSRVTISGTTSRIISSGNYMASSDIGTENGRSNDFDFGWDNNKSRSVIPATEKIMAIKPKGVAWPFHDGSNNIKIYPPVGSLLKNIHVEIPANSASGNTCTLKITNNDGSKVYYQSSPFTFIDGLIDDVNINESISDNLLMTMTNTSGIVFYYTGGIAYMTYI